MIRRLRLASGLVLFTYVTVHFINHSLGLVSVAVMDRVRHAIYVVLTSAPVTLILYSAFVVHYCLALWALWQRRSLKMPAPEAIQLILGFTIPFILIDHVLHTRVADRVFGAEFGYYVSVLYIMFVAAPMQGWLQFTMLLVAWIHAMIGLRFWLRAKPWYERWQPVLFAFALLMPVLAILGVVEGGRQIQALALDPAWVAQLRITHPKAPPPYDALIDRMVVLIRYGFLAALLGVLGARILRTYLKRRHGVVRLTYPSGRVVAVPRGISVLEASRLANIPHAAVCGGRGRCSTCRIRIEGATAAAPAPLPEEIKVLERIAAAPDTRLACQLRPLGDLRVTPLLPANATASDGVRRPAYLQGCEREIAILFGDLRAFTRLSEHRLPYDVVFLLNRYFAEMGHAVEEAGGQIDKFIGDGVMALFGVDSDVASGCRAALAAAKAMSERLRHLNEALADDLVEPLRIGIGIHAGLAIVGEMGYGKAISVTAVGDSVNTASRLEGLTKIYDCELVVSDAVVSGADADLGASSVHEIEIRGRETKLTIHTVASARDLPAFDRPGHKTIPLRPPEPAAIPVS